MIPNTRPVSLNANQLKLIAVAAMVLDHCVAVLLPPSDFLTLELRFFGRVTAPLMCYCIAEGYYHTSCLRNYLGRLLAMAVLAHVPYAMCFGKPVLAFCQSTDVGFSLLLGLAALAILDLDAVPLWGKCLGFLLCCLLAVPADWNYIAVLWIVGFGLLRKDKTRQFLAFCLIAGFYLVQPLLDGMAVSASRLGVFLALPLLSLYDGTRGKKSRWIQYGFYWFYPVHLLILYGVRQLSETGI